MKSEIIDINSSCLYKPKCVPFLSSSRIQNSLFLSEGDYFKKENISYIKMYKTINDIKS